MTKNYITIWLDEVDSTNNQANRTLETAGNLSVVAAKYQTAGRGQRGNVWKSAPGDNLTFTIAVKFGNQDVPSIKASRQFVISQIAALSVKRFLSEYGINARIKWPNDIYVGDKKICGILIEHHVCRDMLKSSIIGVGINLNQTVFPKELPNPTSVKSECGKHLDAESALDSFMHVFLETAGDLREESVKEIDEAYAKSLYRKGIKSEFIRCCDGGHFFGTIKGVGEDARIIIETNDGICEKYAFKDISYVI